MSASSRALPWAYPIRVFNEWKDIASWIRITGIGRATDTAKLGGLGDGPEGVHINRFFEAWWSKHGWMQRICG